MCAGPTFEPVVSVAQHEVTGNARAALWGGPSVIFLIYLPNESNQRGPGDPEAVLRLATSRRFQQPRPTPRFPTILPAISHRGESSKTIGFGLYETCRCEQKEIVINARECGTEVDQCRLGTMHLKLKGGAPGFQIFCTVIGSGPRESIVDVIIRCNRVLISSSFKG